MLPVIALVALAADPIEDRQPVCAVEKATVFYDRFAELPDEIRSDILKGGRVGEKNERWFATDEMTTENLPTRRFVSAGKSGDTWFVWIDHGGFARHYDVFGYRPVYSGMNHQPKLHLMSKLSGEPCAAINAILDGVQSLFE